MSDAVAVIVGYAGSLGAEVVRAFASTFKIVGVDLLEGDAPVDRAVDGDILDESTVARALEWAAELGELQHVVCLVSDSPTCEPEDTPAIIGPERLHDVLESRVETAWAVIAGFESALMSAPGTNKSITFRAVARGTATSMAEDVADAALRSMVTGAATRLADVAIRVGAVAVPDDDTEADEWNTAAASAILTLAVDLDAVTGSVLTIATN